MIRSRRALELGTDYDLATAEVRTLVLERTGPRVSASLVVTVSRRYAGGPDPAGDPALLYLSLRDVTGLRFDSADAGGIALAHEAGEAVVRIGADGRLSAASGTVHPSDSTWHLSTAGRAEAGLRMVKYSATHIQFGHGHGSFAAVNLAVPPGDQASGRPWRIRSFKIADVSRVELRTGAFEGVHAFRTTGESVTLGDGTLRIRPSP